MKNQKYIPFNILNGCHIELEYNVDLIKVILKFLY